MNAIEVTRSELCAHLDACCLPGGRDTAALCVDLVGSTQFGNRFSKTRRDKINIAIVGQFDPLLAALGMDSSITTKFLGDGWLCMSDDSRRWLNLARLGQLALQTIRPVVSAAARIPALEVPGFRAAVCLGRDIPIKLPGGHQDFVGESACRAARLASCSNEDELLCDDEMASYLEAAFDLLPLDSSIRDRSKAPSEVPWPAHVVRPKSPAFGG